MPHYRITISIDIFHLLFGNCSISGSHFFWKSLMFEYVADWIFPKSHYVFSFTEGKSWLSTNKEKLWANCNDWRSQRIRTLYIFPMFTLCLCQFAGNSSRILITIWVVVFVSDISGLCAPLGKLNIQEICRLCAKRTTFTHCIITWTHSIHTAESAYTSL